MGFALCYDVCGEKFLRDVSKFCANSGEKRMEEGLVQEEDVLEVEEGNMRGPSARLPPQLRALFCDHYFIKVFRALGKTMRHMKKHDFHPALERAEEVALLLQHRIARKSEQLLQLSSTTTHDPPQDNSGGRISDFLSEVFESHSKLSGSNDNDTISVESEQILHPSEMTLPELDHQASKDQDAKKKKIDEKKPKLEGRAGE